MANSLYALLDEVHAFDEATRKRGGIVWYRGHSDADWELCSSLHRDIERKIKPLRDPPPYRELLRDHYKTLYRKFKSESWPLLNPAERSEWGIIFAMQHHRFPTRLLDWTESFGCALYFAQYQRPRGQPAAVWAINPELLNELSINQNGIVGIDDVETPTDINTNRWHPRFHPPVEDLPTIAVSPTYANARMYAQRSKFTLSGDSAKPLNKQLHGQLHRDGGLVKFDIPADCFDEIEDFLRVMGIGAFSLMPDIEGLRREHEASVVRSLGEIAQFFPDEIKRASREGRWLRPLTLEDADRHPRLTAAEGEAHGR